MLGPALTTSMIAHIHSLLMAQEHDAKSGHWDEKRWSMICRQVKDMRGRMDLNDGEGYVDNRPNGDPFTGGQNEYAKSAGKLLKMAVEEVYALKPSPKLFDVAPQSVAAPGAWS